jgi:hypothetical protein
MAENRIELLLPRTFQEVGERYGGTGNNSQTTYRDNSCAEVDECFHTYEIYFGGKCYRENQSMSLKSWPWPLRGQSSVENKSIKCRAVGTIPPRSFISGLCSGLTAREMPGINFYRAFAPTSAITNQGDRIKKTLYVMPNLFRHPTRYSRLPDLQFACCRPILCLPASGMPK